MTVEGTVVVDMANVDVWQCVNDSFLPQLHPELRHGYRMVVRCPQGWAADDVRQACENTAGTVDQFLYVAGDTYYSNFHCAICNRVNDSLISMIENSDFCTWRSNTLLECLSFLELGASVNMSSMNNGTLDLPPMISVQEVPNPRLCLLDVEEHCENETGSINDGNSCRYKYAPVIYNGVIAKHPSCPKCNSNVELLCMTTDLMFIDEMTIIEPMMDVGFGIVDIFQQIAVRVDSKFGTSSQCVAGLELNEYGRCVPVTTSWPKCEAVSTQLEQEHGLLYCLRDTFCSFDDFQGGQNVDVEVNPPCFEISHVDNGTLIFDLKYEPDAVPPVEAIEDVIITVLQNQTDNRCWYMEILVNQLCNIATEEANATSCYHDLFVDHPSEFQPTYVYNESLIFYNQTFIQPLWWRNETFIFYDQSKIKSEPRFLLCGVEKVIQTCPTIVVTNDSVEWLIDGNNSAIQYQDTIYNPDEYLLYPDGRISICFIEVEPESDGWILTIVGHVAFAISSVCILATFITYLSFSVLRKRQGIAIMNFLVALFFGQILLQYVGYQMSAWYLPCIVVAALSHFFFLASFVWTTVLAWDLSRSFSSSSMRSLATKSFRRRMISYLLVGWGVPLAFVSITLILQFSNLQTVVLVEYGGPACWFTDRLASIAVFFAPISLCLFMNVILFMVTVHGVHSTKKMTSILKEGQESSFKQQIIELRIYIKVSIITAPMPMLIVPVRNEVIKRDSKSSGKGFLLSRFEMTILLNACAMVKILI